MQLGIDSFAARFDDAGLAVSAAERMGDLLARIEHADQVGLDVFGIGEHDKREFLDSADPVRLFQQFATLDLLAEGRAEMVVGTTPPVIRKDEARVYEHRGEQADRTYIHR